LIKQAESEVSASSAAAFPLGRVVALLLLHGHAAFGEVLFARLNKKCPWVIPHYPVRQPNQPREQYEKSTGRGSDESVQEYIARMNGILTLYFAVLQTPFTSIVPLLPYQPTKEHLVALVTPPLRFTAAWAWLAYAMRDPLPKAPPIATMVRTWVEMVGAEAMRIYGKKQVMKVFEAIYNEGVDSGKVAGDSESARQQLGMALTSSDSLKHPAARDWEV
jgi:nucleoporin GLE1